MALTGAGTAVLGQPVGATADAEMLAATDAEQTAMMKAALDQGFPPALSSRLSPLLFYKSSLVLPLLEQKIEQVLASTTPAECFTGNAVDPQSFIDRVDWIIADTGGEHAISEIGRLVKVDENRFGDLVGVALTHSSRWRNPFVVAYAGLAFGNPAVDRRIVAWIHDSLSVDTDERARAEAAARGFGPTPLSPSDKMRRLWAEALLDRCADIPSEAQWRSDPIASRLRSPLAGELRRQLPQLARDALQGRRPK